MVDSCNCFVAIIGDCCEYSPVEIPNVLEMSDAGKIAVLEVENCNAIRKHTLNYSQSIMRIHSSPRQSEDCPSEHPSRVNLCLV